MMTNGRQSRFQALLLAAIVAAGVGLCAQADATIYRDFFKTMPYGDIWHVACTVSGLADMHYDVDKFEKNNWAVTWHVGGDDSRFGKAQPGEHIIFDNVFTNTP